MGLVHTGPIPVMVKLTCTALKIGFDKGYLIRSFVAYFLIE